MFDRLSLFGRHATLIWGYRLSPPAAVLNSWTLVRAEPRQSGHWILTGTVERADAFQCRQWPLLFTAPRDKGQWAFSVLKTPDGAPELRIDNGRIRARLGAPEF